METINTGGVTERILTLNPDGSRGAILSRRYYDLMRNFIIAAFDGAPEIAFNELMGRMAQVHFIEPYEKAVWHLLKVKQDLQARGIIKVRFIGLSPKQQMLKLNRKALRRFEF
jgi:hypothetical protein